MNTFITLIKDIILIALWTFIVFVAGMAFEKSNSERIAKEKAKKKKDER